MRVTRTLALLVCGGAFATPTLAVGQDAVRRVTLAEALESFGRNSLSLRIARSESAGIAGRARQDRAYANPTLRMSRETLGRGVEDYWETTAGLAQRIEWPGRTAARGRLAVHTVDAAAARFRADSIRLAFEVREAYAQAWLAEEVEGAAAQAADVIRTVAEAAERRLEVGDISPYETRRLRIERVRVDQDLADTRLRVRAARRTLAALIDPEAETLEAAPSEGLAGVPPPIDRRVAVEALAGRPDLEAAAREVDAAAAALSMASAAWAPQPTLNLGYKEQADGFSGATFGVDLPLPLFDRGRAGRDGAAARESAAAQRRDLHRRQAEIDVMAASDSYESARSRLEEVGDELLADAEALLLAARAAYAEGEMTLVEALDAADAFRDARIAAVSLRSRAWIAYYDLLRAMGRAPGSEG
ncbi:TolC family protein [Candidatus Palauibacter sp.]|uniref:TolC family protein n=1 Tax=Candidatus Palauibacter sp. TaxID=3101350 RepID=UPI003B59E569